MNKPIKLKIILPHVPDIELVAIKGLEQMAAFLQLNEEKISEARILINEAIINAFEHSGQADPVVRVEFTISQKQLVILVRDYGQGFDVRTIEDPDIQKKIHSDHKRGWGLKLMKSMSDDFIIESNNKGTKITMTKNLE
jgi:anti-sigma regulatory factor (Ser/Thr protein kinase)